MNPPPIEKYISSSITSPWWSMAYKINPFECSSSLGPQSKIKSSDVLNFNLPSPSGSKKCVDWILESALLAFTSS